MNTYFSKLVTPSGMLTLGKLLQARNAPLPILVTLDGMVTLVRLVQLLNA